MVVADPNPLTPPLSSDGRTDVPRPWVHDPSHPLFLPPNATSSPALSLISDALQVVQEYREFIETVGKLEAEYGRGLTAAVRKLESKLDATLQPTPGGRKKPPEPTLVKALRAHLVETNTIAGLHIKRPGALNDQLIGPLNSLERRIGETSRRFGLWGKDIRTRWDVGRERVDTARAKYHMSVRDHQTALTRLRNCPTPNASSKPEGEWVKLERAATEAEATRADRKRAYLVALAGEGLEGGGGRDLAEGGGDWGWGEEARALYGHVEYTLLELLKHQAHEDGSHNALLSHVFGRGEKCYDMVSIAADQNAFLDWTVTDRSAISRADSIHSSANSNTHSDVTDSFMDPSAPPSRLSTLMPIASIRSSSSQGSERHSWSPIVSSTAGSCLSFVPPPGANDEKPSLDTDKRADRNWLVNRWLQSSATLSEVEGADGHSGTLNRKRQELDKLRELCLTYVQNRGLGDAEDVWERRITLQRTMGEAERKAAVAKAELACLETVLGPKPAPELAHEFKEKQFATRSLCDACGQHVWKPLGVELSCRLCGIALHSKCALHVDPECTGLKSMRRRSTSNNKIRRSITTRLRPSSMFESPHGAPRAYNPNPTTIEPLREDELQVSPFVTTTSELDRPAIVAALTEEPAPTMTVARVVHDYHAQDGTQIHAWAGEVLRVLEPDLDGTGWIRVRRGLDTGDEGLVPQAYLDIAGEGSPAVSDGGSGAFVVALFDFPPPTHNLQPGEASVRKHQLYELSDEGMEFDDNWAELIVPDTTGILLRGVVPKSYIQRCS